MTSNFTKRQTMKILFGQQDYIERIKTYIAGEEEIQTYVFSLARGDPKNLCFDISQG